MKREVINCDHCLKDHVEAYTLHVPIDHCMNGAPSSETQWDIIDLCPSCMFTVLKYIVNKTDYAYNRNLISKWKKR